MPGTLAEAAAAAPSRAGFGSNPNRSTGRPVVASRSADTGYSSAWAASAWACSASLSTGLALWSVSATGHGVDCPAKASACGSPFSRSRKKVFMMFLTCFKNLAMCSCDGFLRLRLLMIHPRTLRPSQRLVAMVFGGFAHALLAGEQFERFDDGLARLLGVDHGVDFTHFQ